MGYSSRISTGSAGGQCSLYLRNSGCGDVKQALQRVYAGLERTLKEYGASFQNVVKENLYTRDIESVKAYNHIRKYFYKGDYLAATWVQISRLNMEQATLEVELGSPPAQKLEEASWICSFPTIKKVVILNVC